MIPETANLTKANSAELATREPAEMAPNRMSIWIWRLLKTTVLLLVLCSALLLFAYRSMHQPPEFFRRILQIPDEDLEIAGDQFETNLLDVQNTIRQGGGWRSVFGEEEANGWMAADCPSKLPELVPDFVEAPRIQILDSEFRFAFRYYPRQTAKWFSPFIVIAGDIFVAEPSGQIALRIKHVKSGIVPIPFTRFADNITDHLRSTGLDVAWTELDGDPMALISIPPECLRVGDQQVRIDTIACQDQQVEIIGDSAKVESASR